DKATEDIKASLTQAVGQPVIEKVLFTDFVIQ
ncbi:flagellar basal body-associated protein FliL, partial [Vibrio fortis]